MSTQTPARGHHDVPPQRRPATQIAKASTALAELDRLLVDPAVITQITVLQRAGGTVLVVNVAGGEPVGRMVAIDWLGLIPGPAAAKVGGYQLQGAGRHSWSGTVSDIDVIVVSADLADILANGPTVDVSL